MIPLSSNTNNQNVYLNNQLTVEEHLNCLKSNIFTISDNWIDKNHLQIFVLLKQKDVDLNIFVKNVGIENALVLLTYLYQNNFFSIEHLGDLLKKIAIHHFESYSLLNLSGLKFNKARINPDFLRKVEEVSQPTNRNLLKAICTVAFAIIGIAATTHYLKGSLVPRLDHSDTCIPVSEIKWPDMKEELSYACFDYGRSKYEDFFKGDLKIWWKHEKKLKPDAKDVSKMGVYLKNGKLKCYFYSGDGTKLISERYVHPITLNNGKCVNVTIIHRGTRYFG